jgi:hypothetical protein
MGNRRHWLDIGTNVIAMGSDIGFMMSGFDAFKADLQQGGVPFPGRS